MSKDGGSRLHLQVTLSRNAVSNSLTILDEKVENSEAAFRLRDGCAHDHIMDRDVNLVTQIEEQWSKI